mgnify:CR=1 FL=1
MTAEDLRTYGVVVLPILSDYKQWSDRIWTAMDEFPEYKVKGRNVQRVLGGFGALGNPSSFHHPTIRALRNELKSSVLPFFKSYASLPPITGDAQECKRLEMLMDRVCVRYRDFGTVSSESWHRDVYDGPKPLLETDEIFGGWVNLSGNIQEFVVLLGSHNEQRDATTGFATQENDGCLTERLRAQKSHSIKLNKKGHVEVPPGHAVIFVQHILHAVLGGKQPDTPELRFFCGYRLTTDTLPLIDNDTVDMGVPRIPSGQFPPMYSQNHYMFFNKYDRFREWGEKTFHPQCLFERVTKTGQRYYTPGCKSRTLPSLVVMGLYLPPYTGEDLNTLSPELI